MSQQFKGFLIPDNIMFDHVQIGIKNEFNDHYMLVEEHKSLWHAADQTAVRQELPEGFTATVFDFPHHIAYTIYEVLTEHFEGTTAGAMHALIKENKALREQVAEMQKGVLDVNTKLVDALTEISKRPTAVKRLTP